MAFVYIVLDFLRPSIAIEAKVCQNQCRQKKFHEFHARDHVIVEKDSVLVKNFGAGEAWLPVVIYSQTGSSSFTVDLMDGRRVRRHLDQLRKNTSATVIDKPSTKTETNDDLSIPMSNSPTAEPPPEDVSPRVSEDLN